MKSWPSRSVTTGTNSSARATVRESIDAPDTATSGPTSRPPTALATSDAVNLIHLASHYCLTRWGTVGSWEPVPAWCSCSVAARPSTTCPACRLATWPRPRTGTASRWSRWELPDQGSGGWSSLLIRFPTNWTPTDPEWPRPRSSPSPDTVVFPLVHGPMGEDGTLQGLLEVADVPYVGSGVLASAVCMDKAMAKLVCAQHGLPQCRYLTASADDGAETVADAAIAKLGLPLFVKPANMGSSVGVSRATTEFETVKALEAAGQYDQTLVIEEAIAGQEIEVAVLGNRDPKASVPGRDRARCRVL